jgi:hypothetical protein
MKTTLIQVQEHSLNFWYLNFSTFKPSNVVQANIQKALPVQFFPTRDTSPHRLQDICNALCNGPRSVCCSMVREKNFQWGHGTLWNAGTNHSVGEKIRTTEYAKAILTTLLGMTYVSEKFMPWLQTVEQKQCCWTAVWGQWFAAMCRNR